MNRALSAIFFASILSSCAHKVPAVADIQEKLLTEYVCRETAKLSHFEIVRQDETRSPSGHVVYRYLVRGVMEWPNGCSDEEREIPAGRQQGFEQTVFLTEGTDGRWQ